MRKREEYFSKITWFLANTIPNAVTYKNKVGLFDINEFSENFMLELLNKVYKLKLINLNEIQYNYPAIDLGDLEQKVSVQVTSDNSSSKIDYTIDKFLEKRLERKFSKLIVLILTNKKKYTKAFKKIDGVDREIIDVSDLLKIIKNLPIDELEVLYDFLNKELTPRKDFSSDDFVGIEVEHHQSLDRIKNLIKTKKPVTALQMLNDFKNASWILCSNKVKYRITTNMAACYHLLKQFETAGKFYVEALQFNNVDEQALHNAALGFQLLNEHEKAEEYALKAIERNPLSKSGHAYLLLARKNQKCITELIKDVPRSILEEVSVSFAVSTIYSERGEIETAIDWARLTMINELEDVYMIKGYLGSLIIHKVSKENNMNLLIKPKPEYYPLIEESYIYLNDAIELLAGTEILEVNNELFLNRGMINYLRGNIDDAIFDLEFVIKSNPTCYQARRALSAFYLHKKDLERAQGSLNLFRDLSLDLVGSLMLADILRMTKCYTESEKILKQILDHENLDSNILNDVNQVLSVIYLEIDSTEGAIDKVNSLIKMNKNNIGLLATKSNLLRKLGKRDEAIELTKETIKLFTNECSLLESCLLGKEAAELKLYEDAIPILERGTEKNPFHCDIKRLLLTYYYAHRFLDAIDLLGCINSANENDMITTEVESAIYEEIGDLEKAKEACLRFLRKESKNLTITVRLGVICDRRSESHELDKLLASAVEIDFVNEREDTLITYAQLLYLRGFKSKSIDFLYEIRRHRFRTSSRAHKAFFELFLKYTNENVEIFNLTEISNEAWFRYRLSDGTIADVVVIKENEKLILDKERKLDDGFVNLFLNKKIGDAVELKKAFASLGATVEDVAHRYVYAFRESAEMLNSFFLDENSIHKMKVPEDLKTTDDLPKQMLDMLAQREKNVIDFEDKVKLYQDSRITFGFLQRFSELSIIELFMCLITDRRLCINAQRGNVKEKETFFNNLKECSSIVLDVSSLITLGYLEILEKVSLSFDEILISQSTLDAVKHEIRKAEAFNLEAEGSLSISMQDGKVFPMVTPKEIHFNNLLFLRNLSDWLSKFTKVVPITHSLKIDYKKVKEFEDILLAEMSDSIYIAIEKKSVVVNDDVLSKDILLHHYGDIKMATSKTVLDYVLSKGKIDVDDYYSCVMKLITFGYTFTDFDHNVFLFAFKSHDFKITDDTEILLSKLDGKISQLNGASEVIVRFLRELWKYSILEHQEISLVSVILEHFTKNRDVLESIDMLKDKIDKHFMLLPLQKCRYVNAINAWVDAETRGRDIP